MANNEKLLALLDRLSDTVDAIRSELEGDTRDSSSGDKENGKIQFPTSESIENTVECFAITDIVSKVEEEFSLSTGDVFANKRAKGKIALARQVAIYLCREMTRTSLLEIARVFGLKDHTTVIHAQRKIAEQLETDTELLRVVESIKAKLSE